MGGNRTNHGVATSSVERGSAPDAGPVSEGATSGLDGGAAGPDGGAAGPDGGAAGPHDAGSEPDSTASGTEALLLARIRALGEVYNLVPYSSGSRCETWTFRPEESNETRGLLVREEFNGRRIMELAWAYELDARNQILRLRGPFEMFQVGGSLGQAAPAGGRREIPLSSLEPETAQHGQRWFLDGNACFEAASSN